MEIYPTNVLYIPESESKNYISKITCISFQECKYWVRPNLMLCLFQMSAPYHQRIKGDSSVFPLNIFRKFFQTRHLTLCTLLDHVAHLYKVNKMTDEICI